MWIYEIRRTQVRVTFQILKMICGMNYSTMRQEHQGLALIPFCS